MIDKLGALVTGGAQRLGRAIALALAQGGHPVAIHCHMSRDAAEATAADIRAAGGRAAVVTADLANETETAALVGLAAAAIGPVGVLVNNASTFERDEWNTADRASWDAHIEPNLRAPFVLTQTFARALPPGERGVVINMLDERVWSLPPHHLRPSRGDVGAAPEHRLEHHQGRSLPRRQGSFDGHPRRPRP